MSIVHGGKRGGERLARRVAHAAGTFEHLLVGRVPSSVTVVADGNWMVLSIHEAFSPGERQVASNGNGGFAKVDAYHRQLFSHGLEALCGHVRTCTGVWFRGGAVHVDRATGSVLKTLTTRREWSGGQGRPSPSDGTGGTRNQEAGGQCWCSRGRVMKVW